MDNVKYWLWLQKCLGVGAKFEKIVDDFGSVENLYNSNIMEWKMSTVLTSKQIDNLGKYTLSDVDNILAACDANDWRIITFDDDNYPQRLKNINNPPAVLYVDGDLPNIDKSVVISIVGTRKASSYAKMAAGIMSKGIAQCGAVVVSGGALGVDSAAHTGAINCGGKTIAVLGNGFGASYLKSNETLRNDIRQNGALITEYPPFTPASRTTFPMRNRIISGLALGVLVVEAGVKSGSLITAKYALEQGKDIYSIPASIFDYAFYGSNKLIDDGATVATSPSILIERYAEQFDSIDMSKMQTVRELMSIDNQNDANAEPKQQVTFDNIVKDRREQVINQEKALQLTGNELIVYQAMSDNYEVVDNIIEKSNLDAKQVLVTLTLLEVKGLIETASGRRYKIK